MVGAWSDFSGAFLMAVGVGAFLLLGMPLLFRQLSGHRSSAGTSRPMTI